MMTKLMNLLSSRGQSDYKTMKHKKPKILARQFLPASIFTLLLLGTTASSLAQDADTDEPPTRSKITEELTVTAQRIEENIQEVPIAVSAFSGDALRDRQAINPSDLQLNVPNVSFTATNFGNSSFSIRGIGRLVISSSGESGVSTHINEIPIESNLNAIEFFDVERVEILRGPQGTLFGRNATGGAINQVIKLPVTNDDKMFSGFVDGEVGDYNNLRLKGAFNISLGDFAFRVAGLSLTRDGYIENTAYEQIGTASPLRGGGQLGPLAGIDESIDGRDINTFRLMGRWKTENSDLWVMYSSFKEDDDKARITNQVCSTTATPILGCEANESGNGAPHIASTTAGIFAAFVGAISPAIPGAGETSIVRDGDGDIIPALSIHYAYPIIGVDNLRTVHTDFDPIYRQDEDLFALGYDYTFDSYTFGLLAAYRKSDSLFQQDYNLDVGPTLDAFSATPRLFPTSRPTGGAGAEWLRSSECNYQDGTSGTVGGCILTTADQTRIFSYDQSDNRSNNWTVEGKISSDYEDSPFNFILGLSTYQNKASGDYFVISNALDLVAEIGLPGNLRLYPSMFNSTNRPLEDGGGILAGGFAAYGEVYYKFSDRLKLTVGARYNTDTKEVYDANAFFSALDANFVLGGFFSADPIFIRTSLFQDMTGDPLNPPLRADLLSDNSQALLDYWVEQGNDAVNVYNTHAPSILGAAGAAIAAGGVGAAIGAAIAAAATAAEITAAEATALAAVPPTLLPSVKAILSGNATTIAADPLLSAGAAGLQALFEAVPPVPGYNELRTITGSPTSNTWNAVTGRVVLDWQFTDDNLLYASVSRGYKPGGFNPPLSADFINNSDSVSFTFDREAVSAIEVGSKNVLWDDQILLNASVFAYDYSDLQVTRIVNNSSLNDNIDADIYGLEADFIITPEFVPGLTIDASYSYLSATVDKSSSIDPINRTAGDPDWILIANAAPSAPGAVYIVRREALTAAVVAAVSAITGAVIPIPGYSIGEGESAYQIPSIINRGALTGVLQAGVAALPEEPTDEQQATYDAALAAAISNNVRDGIPIDLDSNTLPNSPEHTLHLGVAYSLNLNVFGGGLTPRWDFYWQSQSYAREFNTIGDEIDAWAQHNFSLIWEHNNGKFDARFWIRNIFNKENVTGKYLTTDTSGFFRNYFLTEPRIFGISVRAHL